MGTDPEELQMKIAILSRNPKLYSTRRLKEAAKERGHTVKVLDVLKFVISLEEEYPDLYYNGKPLSAYDAVIPRIGASITYFGTAVVRQFEQMDVYTPNKDHGGMYLHPHQAPVEQERQQRVRRAGVICPVLRRLLRQAGCTVQRKSGGRVEAFLQTPLTFPKAARRTAAPRRRSIAACSRKSRR